MRLNSDVMLLVWYAFVALLTLGVLVYVFVIGLY